MQLPRADSSFPTKAPDRPRRRQILAIGLVAFLAALAGRLALIRDFGTSLPYQDQWKFTGVDVLKPWLDGSLTLGSLFKPIND
ncbi:MAG: hypothetical protein HYV75_03595, partial [Opitutae bacterium]|nr:hypothetical protein [Opitutae bacterium]